MTVNNKSTEEEALRMAEKLRTKGYFYRIKEGDKPIANDSSLFRFYVSLSIYLGVFLIYADIRMADLIFQI